MKTRTTLLTLAAGALLCLAFLAWGCSDSTEPAPARSSDGLPDFPEPTSAPPTGGDCAHVTEVQTTIKPLKGYYWPKLQNYRADFSWQRRSCSETAFIEDCGSWSTVTNAAGWAWDLKPSCADFKVVPWMVGGSGEWVCLLTDGVADPPAPFSASLDGDIKWCLDTGLTWHWKEYRNLKITFPALAAAPYLRADDYWEAIPLQRVAPENAGAGDAVPGPTKSDCQVWIDATANDAIHITSTYSVGVTETDTESFGSTVSVTGSAGVDKIAAIQGTLSQTFSSSHSTSVATISTNEFSEWVHGEEGKVVCFMLWEHVTEYRFTDAKGEPFTDPNYTFYSEGEPDLVVRRDVYLKRTPLDKN